MIGRSPSFVRALALLDRFSCCDAPVLIEGETGTGKELAARHIHYAGARKSGAFVPINCGAVPDNLFENELFGHSRGAFTDARAESIGLVGLAQGGTLFLDEVDSLSGKGQVALLRFLQDRCYRPLGAHSEHRADVRVIAASNVALQRLVEGGRFRQDLLFRVNLLFLELPPLRQRPGDARLLAQHFIDECSRRYGIPAKRLTPQGMAWLDRYHWPGNVRELENLVHRAFLLSDGFELSVSEVTGTAVPADRSESARATGGYRAAKALALEEFDRRYLTDLLSSFKGNVSCAARYCGKERRALGRLIRKYNIDPARFREL